MMKTWSCIVVFLCCSVLNAAQTLEIPHVAVYGTSETQVAPNEMNWRLTVRNEAKALPEAASAHTATVKTVLDFLKRQGIDEKKLQTSHMQFGENWEYRERERVKTGYFASTDISFTISDLALYETLWFGLSQNESVSIQSIQYAHGDRIRLQNETRQKAVLAARDKAAELAKTLGSQIAEPLSIEETSPQSYPMPYANFVSNTRADMGESSAAQVLAPGQITISTQVRVVFRLRN